MNVKSDDGKNVFLTRAEIVWLLTNGLNYDTLCTDEALHNLDLTEEEKIRKNLFFGVYNKLQDALMGLVDDEYIYNDDFNGEINVY